VDRDPDADRIQPKTSPADALASECDRGVDRAYLKRNPLRNKHARLTFDNWTSPKASTIVRQERSRRSDRMAKRTWQNAAPRMFHPCRLELLIGKNGADRHSLCKCRILDRRI
jgi:hypothetical protein